MFQKCFIKTKASIKIRLCGIIAETDANNYGLGLKRASLNSMEAFLLSFWKNFVIFFFAFDAFCLVLAHKKTFSIF
ncbi:hypothetical protein FIM57_01550 [Helicobacter pylori]|nr:hypothetical protein FIM57_01550 [Helicobacter pylori]